MDEKIDGIEVCKVFPDSESNAYGFLDLVREIPGLNVKIVSDNGRSCYSVYLPTGNDVYVSHPYRGWLAGDFSGLPPGHRTPSPEEIVRMYLLHELGINPEIMLCGSVGHESENGGSFARARRPYHFERGVDEKAAHGE